MTAPDKIIMHGRTYTLEEPERWQYSFDILTGADELELDAIHNKLCRLIAYRRQYAPDYVVPEEGYYSWYVYSHQGDWFATSVYTREPTTVYFPKDIAQQLADDLNSGRVVL